MTVSGPFKIDMSSFHGKHIKIVEDELKKKFRRAGDKTALSRMQSAVTERRRVEQKETK